MGPMSLPPGFRFHPTDDELVGYYLKRKVDGRTIELEVIPVIELYKFDPWELPDKSFLPKRDMEWFFFCPRDKKYPNGSRTNRATASGYWKATGKDRKVFCESSVQGLRKTLVFYHGRAPGGERTDWVMHEYRLCEDLSQATPNFLGAFALCRVVKRNEQGLKMGDSIGESKGKRSFPSEASDLAPRKSFNKGLTSSEQDSPKAGSLFEISNDSPLITSSESEQGLKMGDPIGESKGKRSFPSEASDFTPRKSFNKCLTSSEQDSPKAGSLFEISNDSPLVTSSESERVTEIQPIMPGIDQSGFWGSQYLCDVPKDYSLEQSFMPEPVYPSQFPTSTESCPSSSISPVSSYASFTEETYLIDELNGHGSFSPFSSPLHHMNVLCNEEDMGFQGLDWQMQRCINTPINGIEIGNNVLPPLMCRQASDVEEMSLWLQEDSLLAVM